MIKRTIEISSEAAHLTVKNEQLLILAKDDERTQRASIPCEDIGLVLSEHPGTTYAHAALDRLCKYGAGLVICGRDHLPTGLLLPIGEHSQVVPRIHTQIAIKKPLRKQLWKQIVAAKIRAQAGNLTERSAERSRMLALARSVRSGDPSNVESHAAQLYWRHWLDEPEFRRRRDGPPPNNLLNYGYAVMRAAIARAVVAAGLLPALGLHHHNRSNAFCLADDLVEPLRPIVDEQVRKLHRDGQCELIPMVKKALLELLTVEIHVAGQRGPLMVALHRYVASLVSCYEGETKRLSIPTMCENGPAGNGA